MIKTLTLYIIRTLLLLVTLVSFNNARAQDIELNVIECPNMTSTATYTGTGTVSGWSATGAATIQSWSGKTAIVKWTGTGSATVTCNTSLGTKTYVTTVPSADLLSVTISGNDVLCSGETSSTFSASVSPFYARSSVSYSWVKNGIPIIPDPGDPSTVTVSGLQDKNAIRCDVVTSVRCVTPSASSNTITITAITSPQTLTIDVSPSKTQLCAGESVTFNATPNRAVSGNYTWYENGVPQSGITGNSYTTTAVSAGQLNSITATAQANVPCSALPVSGSGNASAFTFVVTPRATMPTAIGGSTTPCTGTKPAFTTTSYNATDYTWTVTPSTAGTFTKTINGNTSTGTLTLNASFGATTAQTATVNVLATGCSGAVAGTPLTITVKPNVTTPAPPASDGGRCIGDPGTTSFTTSGGNADSYQWSFFSPAGTSTIGATTGIVTWDATYSGTATILAKSVGCGGPSTAPRHYIQFRQKFREQPLLLLLQACVLREGTLNITPMPTMPAMVIHGYYHLQVPLALVRSIHQPAL